MAGKAAVAHVNTQDNPRLAGRFGVRGVPVVYLFLTAQILKSSCHSRHSSREYILIGSIIFRFSNRL
ncbi:MAG TPA: hypothetical protein HPP94_03910 [Desulfuromonadales bacterium]|nr:hypothetical protein [Desulfuromonadales bacterium]